MIIIIGEIMIGMLLAFFLGGWVVKQTIKDEPFLPTDFKVDEKKEEIHEEGFKNVEEAKDSLYAM